MRKHNVSPDPHQEHQQYERSNQHPVAIGSDAALSAYGALRRLRRPGLILGALIFGGCSTGPRIPYTAADQTAAVIPNMADVRVFADVPAARFRSALCPNLNFAVGRAAAPTYLALSGGGADGAYGAGVLDGWTASGTRPEFTIVSGVSTGAMIAPFAFLGPSYDEMLRQLYASGVAESLLENDGMGSLCYRRHRFLPEVIQHAIWLYLRFTLSYRDVEELLAERGLEISYETVRRWVLKFGPAIARRLRQRRPRPSDHWHLDEMVVRIGGERVYLWRAVDHGRGSRHASPAPTRQSSCERYQSIRRQRQPDAA